MSEISPLMPPWLKAAIGEIGTKEIKGINNNPRIIEYHKSTNLGALADEVPWCSSFANWCMEKAGIKGTGKANARSWLEWGNKITLPAFGCVVILARGNDPVQGHVGFFVGFKNATEILLLAGNQSDQVCVQNFQLSKILGYRWP